MGIAPFWLGFAPVVLGPVAAGAGRAVKLTKDVPGNANRSAEALRRCVGLAYLPSASLLAMVGLMATLPP